MTAVVQNASLVLRWLYAVALLASLPTVFALWWSLLAGAWWFVPLSAPTVGCMLLLLWRAGTVLRHPTTLDTPQPKGRLRHVRHVGIVCVHGVACGPPGMAAQQRMARGERTPRSGAMVDQPEGAGPGVAKTCGIKLGGTVLAMKACTA